MVKRKVDSITRDATPEANQNGSNNNNNRYKKVRRSGQEDSKKLAYYAVRAGRQTGIFHTWADCERQVVGYKGCAYKKFQTPEEAQSYINGTSGTATNTPVSVKSTPSSSVTRPLHASSPAPLTHGNTRPNATPSHGTSGDRFYVVARGNTTGIFTTWRETQEATAVCRNPIFRKFDSRAEAEAFLKDKGTSSYNRTVSSTSNANGSSGGTGAGGNIFRPAEVGVRAEGDDKDITTIFTDGSSRGNGRVGASAGVGVFFGPDDPRNISERLAGDPQTNQRAELTAILRALEVSPVAEDVRIVTDSRYSIDCVTTWLPRWKSKKWVTSGGQAVKNQDLIKAIDAMQVKRTEAGAKTHYEWVKGHDASEGNEQADRLAVAGSYL